MRAVILITENPVPSPGQAHEERKAYRERRKNGSRLQLFQEGLRCMGHDREASGLVPDQIAVTEYGKPFFKDIPQVRISLSHSGKYLACAFSDEEIGLDLQECVVPRTGVLRIAKRFFTSEEYDALLSIPVENEILRNEFFFRLWSLKEAYLKYIGCGLQGGLNSFQPDPLPLSAEFSAPRGTIRVLKEKNLMTPAEYSFLPAPQGCIMAVSAKRLPDHIQVRQVDFSDGSFQR